MPTVATPVPRPSPGPRSLPALPVQLGICAALGLLLWVAYGGGYVSLDAMWSLAWGRDLVDFAPLARSGTTTPHVLSNLIGAALTPLGPDADYALVAIEFLAAGSLVWFTACLAYEIAGTTAAVAAGVLMALREQLLYATTSTFLDVLVAALVVWAALLVVRGVASAAVAAAEPAAADGSGARGEPATSIEPPASPRGACVLLLLAGMLRPEAWVLAGSLWLWTVLRGRGPALGQLAVVVAAPASWFVADAALNGDALFSIHETSRVNALVRAGKEIPDSLKEQVISIPRNIGHSAGPEIILVVLVIALAALWPALARRRPLALVALPSSQLGAVRVLLAGSALYAAVLAAEALSGALLFARFGISLTAILVAISAVGLVAIGRALSAGAGETSRRPQVAVAVMVSVLAMAQVPLLIDARRITGEEHDRYSAARDAITPGVPCAPVAAPNTNIRAYIAVWADLRGGDVIDAATQPVPARATYITAEGAEPDKLLRDKSFPQVDAFPAAPPVRQLNGWIVTSTCGAGG